MQIYKPYKKRKYLGHGSPYDGLFNKVFHGASSVVQNTPIAEDFRAGTKKLMLKQSEKAINNILESGGSKGETKKILRQTGTTIRKKLGRAAKMRLKNGIFNPSYSPPANTLKGGTILYSLVSSKKSLGKRSRKKSHKK